MSFCTGCGKPLQEGARFCTECGTPAQGAAAQTPASDVTSAAAAVKPAQVEAPPPVAPESSSWEPTSGNGPSKGMIVLGVVLVLLIVAAVAGTFYMKSENAGSAAVAKQGAAIPESLPATTNSVIEFGNNLNLGSYPGATAIPLANFQGENVFAAFLTRDTPEQVIGFYKVRFPVAETSTLDSGTQLIAALPNGEHIRVVAETKPNGTEVKIIRE